MTTLYAIHYQIGGFARWSWIKLFQLYNEAEAAAKVAEIRRMGYLARMVEPSTPLPTAWEEVTA